MTQPLAGIRIADFSHVMAGPYASHLLRLMGADVIKIESPKGDNFRSYGSDPRFEGLSPAFIAANAGKKSIMLDLKDPADLDIAHAIVARCDVMLENFRPGVITRLGLGYEAVRELRPDIIFCSVSGYGQDSAQRDWPAIDNIVQATSGMMMLSGEEGDPPVRVGFPIVDTLTGQTAALAILSALVRRLQGGGGSYIDVSMFDASLAFMTSAVTPYLLTGQAMSRMGNTGYSGLPTASLFTARDGRQISLGVVQPNQFAALARFTGREDWLTDPLFATPEARRANFDAMKAELERVFATRDAAAWEAGLSEAGIPCGMVRRVDEAAELARPDALVSFDIPEGPLTGPVRYPGAGFRLTPGLQVGEVPPRLDENRAEILDWLNRSEPGH
ncbi:MULTISPECIES: CaiB/BaiF CoA transferase family protein [unclassified Sphingobium]|uniref:CaiB/BaiF CoA transferase family protein n=1 Tax=unclassified Sphingobium TaxID=2611147 RepID=UPI002224071D|nr:MULTISPECIES: CoA transferase [unclassified Sphingobium]MCW2382276.1 crotonobetainyl-CoA:carnitine CoA-transferase CaiB-like acyl-CoA transferase [Sphingobium sp. B2D3B]MCW2387520.1 crotonobetainyl-CoA:carnitine CoA-transferase CaiB-like acyl-CoA transferase [Sphingobium sp. B11D3B]MCW2397551.1 crotonobetainyl-CoA:carnitine CoA-transferase CaiB-like acyl-CoA transferase [Sphingobium sp. B2D3C]